MDSTLGFPVSVRSFGKWGARIENSRSFVTQIVGSQLTADDQKVHSYFIGEIIQNLSKTIATAINVNKISILEVSSALGDISKLVNQLIEKEFQRFGIEIVNFNIESINIPDEEMEKIQKVFEKTLEAKELSKVQVGGAFNTIKTFEVLNNAAENPAEGVGVGAMLGAGIGLGAGLPLGSQIGQKLDINEKQNTTQDPTDRLKKLKDMLEQGLITEEQFNLKRDEILKDI